MTRTNVGSNVLIGCLESSQTFVISQFAGALHLFMQPDILQIQKILYLLFNVPTLRHPDNFYDFHCPLCLVSFHLYCALSFVLEQHSSTSGRYILFLMFRTRRLCSGQVHKSNSKKKTLIGILTTCNQYTLHKIWILLFFFSKSMLLSCCS